MKHRAEHRGGGRVASLDARRRRRAGGPGVLRSLPIADAPALGTAARRAFFTRALLTGALALLVGAAVVAAARSRSRPAVPVATSGSTTEVVLDVSGSVGQLSYGVVDQALRRLSRGSSPVGLVLFSDTAEEALPPGSPPAALRPFARVFTPLARPPYAALGQPPRFPRNPWSPSFSGGTRISAGLAAALAALRRDRARGRVLLISDLGDAPSDRPSLRRALVALGRAGVELRALTLPNALASDRSWFARVEGRRALVTRLPAPRRVQAAGARASTGAPTLLAALAALVALALAANELFARSLRWRPVR